MCKWFCLTFIVTAMTLCADEVSTPAAVSEKPKETGILPKQAADVAVFTPPQGWRLADTKALPPSVKIMVVGKGERDFPPSMNLGTEPFDGTLKDYLKVVKSINDAQGATWKDLGMIRTEAGEASLSQLDTKTEWGNVKMMHVMMVKNGTVYILTAAALQEEFPKFYKDFFDAMKSFRFN